MAVTVVGCEKGGVGKTTVAVHHAIWLASQGKDVLLLDVDPQGSSKAFVDRRNELHPDLPVVHVAQCSGDVAKTVRDMARRYEHVIVDAGGRNSIEFRSALRAANTLIVPVRPSMLDLETLAVTAELLTAAREWNEELAAHVLINMSPTNPRIAESANARDYIAQYPEFELVPTVLSDRKAFRDATLDGLAVMEVDSRSAAAAEMEAVAQHIFPGMAEAQEHFVSNGQALLDGLIRDYPELAIGQELPTK